MSLAILGNPPAFSEPLHVGCPNIGDRRRLIARINAALDRRWLTNGGPLVEEFEAAVAAVAGASECVVTSNGTAALELAIRALGMSGRVIVPSFTFSATIHALTWQRIEPVFADIDPLTLNIAPAEVERLMTPEVTGIIGVHLWGRGCDVESLSAIANEHRIPLLFDAAHAFGCSYHQRPIGSFGDAEIFSFHGTKFINSFEGGAIVTDSYELAERLRLMRNFGFAGYDDVIHAGTNGKMNEAEAAMGLTNLESMSVFIDRNRSNHDLYSQLINTIPGLNVLTYDPSEHQNYQYVVVDVQPEVCGLSRDQLLQVLFSENVLARRYFYPGAHRMTAFREFAPVRPLPVTESFCSRLLLLPTGMAIDDAAVQSVCEIIRIAIERAPEVVSQIRSSPQL
jgi:dTDP-4-amino-4,6-dideoxygalactose transaminase